MNSIPSSILAGKNVLVTGAARGIGHSIAAGMANAGARVILTDLPGSDCAATAENIRAKGNHAHHYYLDVTAVHEATLLAAEIDNKYGPIHCLVNNAGIIIREGIDSPNSHTNLHRMMDVNLHGTFNVIHAFLSMLRNTRGNIINIASGAAFVGLPNTLGYSASKGAIRLLTQSLANDLGSEGIRVNAIAPGVITTPMTDATRHTADSIGKFLQRIPLQRLGNPDEIAGPAVFLASEMATYITGVTLPVDGGYLAV